MAVANGKPQAKAVLNGDGEWVVVKDSVAGPPRRDESVEEKAEFLVKEEGRSAAARESIEGIAGAANCPVCRHPLVGRVTRKGPRWLCLCAGHKIWEDG